MGGLGSYKDDDFTVYKVTVTNIAVNDFDGLAASFDIHKFNEDGSEFESLSTLEWIDLNDGLLTDADCHLDHSEDYKDLLVANEAVSAIVNDYLRENPIPESTLQSYRDAKEAQEQEFRATL